MVVERCDSRQAHMATLTTLLEAVNSEIEVWQRRTAVTYDGDGGARSTSARLQQLVREIEEQASSRQAELRVVRCDTDTHIRRVRAAGAADARVASLLGAAQAAAERYSDAKHTTPDELRQIEVFMVAQDFEGTQGVIAAVKQREAAALSATLEPVWTLVREYGSSHPEAVALALRAIVLAKSAKPRARPPPRTNDDDGDGDDGVGPPAPPRTYRDGGGVPPSPPRRVQDKLTRRCPLYARCKAFIATHMRGVTPFLEVANDRCFCDTCHAKRRDPPTVDRAGHPYALPVGWCRLSLNVHAPRAEALGVFDRSSGWHVAYHGTRCEYVMSILETGQLLMPGDTALNGDVLKIRDGHIKEESERWNRHTKASELFDPKQIFMSPSIVYSGCSVYAKTSRFDGFGRVRTVLQLRVPPANRGSGCGCGWYRLWRGSRHCEWWYAGSAVQQ